MRVVIRSCKFLTACPGGNIGVIVSCIICKIINITIKVLVEIHIEMVFLGGPVGIEVKFSRNMMSVRCIPDNIVGKNIRINFFLGSNHVMPAGRIPSRKGVARTCQAAGGILTGGHVRIQCRLAVEGMVKHHRVAFVLLKVTPHRRLGGCEVACRIVQHHPDPNGFGVDIYAAGSAGTAIGTFAAGTATATKSTSCAP